MFARGLSQCCEVWRIVGFTLLGIEFMLGESPVMPVLAFRSPFLLPQGICPFSDLLLAGGWWRPTALPVALVCGSPSHFPSACVRGGWSFRPAAVSLPFACLASCWVFHEHLLGDLNQLGRSKFQTKSASAQDRASDSARPLPFTRAFTPQCHSMLSIPSEPAARGPICSIREAPNPQRHVLAG